MATDALEVRIARLEGAYEQIDRRLANVENGQQSMRLELNSKIDRLEQKVDTVFRWLIGVIIINWITVMLAIFRHG